MAGIAVLAVTAVAARSVALAGFGLDSLYLTIQATQPAPDLGPGDQGRRLLAFRPVGRLS